LLLIYFFILFCLLSISNVFVIWFIIELIFIFFLLIIINIEIKRVGLIIYFFFQRVISLCLFIVIIFSFEKLIFLLLSAKLGLFPFFYWMIVVRVKVGIIGNLFILRLQKIRVFWLLWLLMKTNLGFIYLFVYASIFFVIVNLLIIRDLWLLLVYSSIANTGMIMLRVYGSNYIYVILLYLSVIFCIIYLIIKIDRYLELLLLVFFFIVIPPFLLFFIKFYIILSLDFMLKLGFFLALFDVFVLLYYFSIIFIKFLLIDLSILIYLINLFLLLLMLIFRNCVAMIVFY
jgi:hypothetical protein